MYGTLWKANCRASRTGRKTRSTLLMQGPLLKTEKLRFDWSSLAEEVGCSHSNLFLTSSGSINDESICERCG